MDIIKSYNELRGRTQQNNNSSSNFKDTRRYISIYGNKAFLMTSISLLIAQVVKCAIDLTGDSAEEDRNRNDRKNRR